MTTNLPKIHGYYTFTNNTMLNCKIYLYSSSSYTSFDNK